MSSEWDAAQAMTDDVSGLDSVLSQEGWAYASAPPVEPGDPGRFHALFGRDSLITALQVLPARPDVARATLRALAARQGRREDALTLEAPGKIGHEFRAAPPEPFVRAGWPGGGTFAYYGTADASSWFVVLAGALGDPDVPGWREAASWIAQALDAGGGLIRHAPGEFGLTQMGWRDTIDGEHGGGIAHPDGTLADPPLADADTQAVTVAALRAAARLSGDATWSRRADDLRAAITAAFDADTMALEGEGRPVPGAGSQLGWLLWADALEPAAARAAADRLVEPDILTDFGLRTLAATRAAVRPARLSPRLDLAVRLVARLGRPARRRPRATRRSACAGRAARARSPRPLPRALRRRRRPRRRSRSPTASRPGRSVPASRSSSRHDGRIDI